MQIEWWMWVVGGMALVLAELAITSFFVVWFGLAALLVGLLAWLFPALSLTAQLAFWSILSIGLIIVWFRIFKPSIQKTRVGQAPGEAIGEIGLLVGAIEPFGRGKVRFQRPIIGAEEWACLAEEAIPAGERVRVVAVEGSYLKVVRA